MIHAASAADKGVLIKKGLGSGHLDQIAPGVDPVQASMDLILAGEAGGGAVSLSTLNPAHLRANVAAAKRC